jgi:hypothetical protein
VEGGREREGGQEGRGTERKEVVSFIIFPFNKLYFHYKVLLFLLSISIYLKSPQKMRHTRPQNRKKLITCVSFLWMLHVWMKRVHS